MTATMDPTQGTEELEKLEKLVQDLVIVPEPLVQEVVPTKKTLFYVQYPTIYQIFIPQPPRPTSGRIFVHIVRHAEV
jgi:hypothetical protein